jgi:pimeloyl-ACP methyl ester carboxylesterase
MSWAGFWHGCGRCRVIRVDLLGHGRSSSPAGGYSVPAQARRDAAALDRLGASRVTVIGHSMACMVATSLAAQRPDKVAPLALIDMGPSLDAAMPEGLLVRLLLARFPGRLLWRLRNEATIRKALNSAFTEDARYSSSSAAAYRAVPGARVELLPGRRHVAAGLRRSRRAPT